MRLIEVARRAHRSKIENASTIRLRPKEGAVVDKTKGEVAALDHAAFADHWVATIHELIATDLVYRKQKQSKQEMTGIPQECVKQLLKICTEDYLDISTLKCSTSNRWWLIFRLPQAQV